ncbi:uncharacterized protein DEA37_0009782 [Paragonimus westermani]|uniref:Endonuclease/exonuclease/phosphatase domain-containing protein n=1 Tax=Paragonimus westermani TaxID=34504 RepID=A0A5J4N6P2_9TREM|nr:uncharacterized protein DEA37_0009782 [Paragonimus westermani]
MLSLGVICSSTLISTLNEEALLFHMNDFIPYQHSSHLLVMVDFNASKAPWVQHPQQTNESGLHSALILAVQQNLCTTGETCDELQSGADLFFAGSRDHKQKSFR